jgi:glycosyltransferase involved in cell wall biosynthesis
MEPPLINTFEAQASKRVSFILTTKNKAEFLRKALELHRKLVKPDDELIIIDGGSTDHTPEIINHFTDMVTTFISEPDLSPGHAMGKGMVLSQGKYLKFLTDDDTTYPQAMEQAISVLEKNPEVDILVCGGMRQRGEHIFSFYVPPGVNYGKGFENALKYGACGVGFIIRRSALPITGLFHPTNLAADKEFILRAISQGANVKFCRIKLFYHQVYDHSVIVSKATDFQKDDLVLLKEYGSPDFLYRRNKRRWWPQVLAPWLRRHTRLYRFARTLLNIAQTVSRREKAAATQGLDSATTNEEPVWDGGFS